MENQPQKNEKERIEPKNPEPKLKTWTDKAKFALVILLVLAAGFFAVNQLLKFKYQSELLATPCQLCQDLNKNQSHCIQGCFTIQKQQLIPNINLTNIGPIQYTP